MHACRIPLYILIPIKAISEKGLGHSPLVGIATPFSACSGTPFVPEQQIVSGQLTLIRGGQESSVGQGIPQENTPLFLKQSKLYTDIFYYLKFLNNVFYLQIKPDNKIVNKHELPSLPNCRQYLSSEITDSPFIYLIHINEKIIIIVK